MVNLGDEVKDVVTEFQGIVVAKTKYLHGCSRVGVQPKIKKDGTLPEHESFDEPSLVVVFHHAVPEGNHSTGGPEKYKDKKEM